MMGFREHTIKTRLIVVVLLTSAIGIICAGLGVLVFERVKQKEILAEEMSILLRVIASRSAAALSFKDQLRANDNLNSLLLRESIVLSCMYDSNNKIFTKVVRESKKLGLCPDESRSPGVYFKGQYLDAYQSVQLNGVEIGSVMLRAGLVELDRRIQTQIPYVGMILFFSLLTALLLTSRLQRAVYQPIVDLGEVVRKIKEQNKFVIRDSKLNEDEISQTISAFHSLLCKIESDKEELARLTYYDPLTKLANRRMFGERLVFALENARRSGEKMGLLFLNLDKFKDVNDALGHDKGDLMLKETAGRLESALPLNATAFRFGGDEFIILQVGVSQVELELTAQKILDMFSKPLDLTGNKLSISSSIGIALSDGNDTENSIMKKADLALSEAKCAGRSMYKVYDVY